MSHFRDTAQCMESLEKKKQQYKAMNQLKEKCLASTVKLASQNGGLKNSKALQAYKNIVRDFLNY